VLEDMRRVIRRPYDVATMRQGTFNPTPHDENRLKELEAKLAQLEELKKELKP
jgi:hypothetical protein